MAKTEKRRKFGAQDQSYGLGLWGGVEVDLLRKKATELHRTLGYHLNIADNNTEVVKQHVSKSKSFNTAIL